MTALRLKTLGWILLAAAGLVVAAALMTPYLLDSDAARRTIASFLETRLGRKVVIGGRLRFTLMPHTGFVIEDLRIAETAAFGGGEAARLKTVEVALDPLPLLHRRLVLESIRIRSPRVRLIRNARGDTSWDQPGAGDARPVEGLGIGGASVLLEFNTLQVQDGQIEFSDLQHQRHFRFSSIDFLRNGKEDHDFSLSAEAACDGCETAGLDRFTARLHSSGHCRLALSEGRLALEGADLKIDLFRRTPSESPAALPSLSGQLSGAWPEGRIRLEKLLLKTPGGSLRGELKGLLNKETWSATGPLQITIGDLKRFVESFGGAPPRLLEKWLPRADIAFDLSAAAGTLALDRIQGQLGAQPISGRLTFASGEPALISAALTTGDLNLDSFITPDGASPPSGPPLSGLIGAPIGVDLVLDADSIAWQGEKFTVPRIEIHGRPKSGWDLNSATAVWHDASLSINGSLRPEDRNVRTALNIAALGVESGRLWKLAGTGGEVSGPMDLAIHLQSHGADWGALAHNLAASTSITTRGALKIGGEEHPAISGTLHAETGPEGALRLTSEWGISHPALHGRLTLEGTRDSGRLGLEDARLQMAIESADLPEAQKRFDLEGSLSLTTEELRLDYRVERFSAFGLQGQGRLQWPVAGDFRRVQASLDVPVFQARPWLALMGVKLPAGIGAEVLQRLGFSANLDLAPPDLAVRDLVLVVDDTTVRGGFDMTDDAPLKLRFTLDADDIDLDRYRLSEKTTEASGEDPAASVLGRIDAQGTLNLDRLHLLGCETYDVSSRIRTAEGRIYLDSFDGNLYQGRIEADAMLALDGSDPAWRLKTTLRQVALLEPLQQIFEVSVLSGLADIDAQLSERRRDDAAPRVAGLCGQIDWVLHQGAIQGICIVPQKAPETAASADCGPAPDDQRQPFDEIRGSWQITDGVAATQSHRLTAEGLFMAAAGKVDLVQRRLDATLAVDIQGMPTVYYGLAGPFDGIHVEMDKSRLMIDGANHIVGSPLVLGRGVLGSGADILEKGRQTIGDDSGLQRMGQGALGAGKGVLRLGQGVLEIGKGTEKVEEGLKDLGQSALDLGNGALGLGTDVVNVFEKVGQKLGHLFGGAAVQKDPNDTSTKQKASD